MATINVAYTAKLNPPTATPALTRAQVWVALQRKIRYAQEFVPVIASCEVLSDKDGVVDRMVIFKEGQGHRAEARETVRSWADSWVDFEQDDGSHIRNIISDGPSGEDSDLHMTYMFEFRVPNIQEGTPEAEKEKVKLKALAKKAVESSIDTIREMVKDGRIKE